MILFVVGTRAEAVQLLPLAKELKKNHPKKPFKICSTGEGLQGLDAALKEFGLTAEFNLRVGTPTQTPNQVIERALPKIQSAIDSARAKSVGVFGGSASALAGALAARGKRLPLYQFEGGVRSGDLEGPWPEEGFRLAIDRWADKVFVSTKAGEKALKAEGVAARRVTVTGHLAVDAGHWASNERFDPFKLPFRRLGFNDRRVTVYWSRPEAQDPGLVDRLKGIEDLAKKSKDVVVSVPLPANPAIQAEAKKTLKGKNVEVLKTLSYVDFIQLVGTSEFLVTDCSQLVVEIPNLDKPVLDVRARSDRPEGLKAGCAQWIASDRKKWVSAAHSLLGDDLKRRKMGKVKNPFGDGKAATRIAPEL